MLSRRRSLLLVALLLLSEAAMVPAANAAFTTSPADRAGERGLLDDKGGLSRPGRALVYPQAPEGGSRTPAFVHQTQNNCAFASAAMLLDKWAGREPDQQALRRASGVPDTQGVSFNQLARAVGRVTGIDLRYSPGGGDPMNWNDLLERLSKGGGAILGGSYARLPTHYQRWNREYAALGPRNSGHAVYMERYEPGRRGGRVWIMDPLASGVAYRGEWISTVALRRYAWTRTGGLIVGAATPEPLGLDDYQIGDPALGAVGTLVAGGRVELTLPVRLRKGWRKPADLALAVVWRPLELDPQPTTAGWPELPTAEPQPPSTQPKESLRQPAGFATAQDRDAKDILGTTDDAAGTTPGAAAQPPTQADDDAPGWLIPDADRSRTLVPLSVRNAELVGSVTAPAEAGRYRLVFEVRHRDDGAYPRDELPELEPLEVHLRGPLAAAYGEAALPEVLERGMGSSARLELWNLGGLDWDESNPVRLRAVWHTAAGDWEAGTVPVELASGASDAVTIGFLVPTRASKATLTLELLDSAGVPFAAYGAQPVAVEFDLATPTVMPDELLSHALGVDVDPTHGPPASR